VRGPGSRGTVVTPFLPVLAAIALNPLVALLQPGDLAVATERARAVADLERAVGIFVEQDVAAWLAARPTLSTAAAVLYLFAHLPAAIGALVWVRLERPDHFTPARALFVGTQLLLVAGYVLLPTAPPRLVAELGFSDTLTGALGAGGSDLAHSLQTPWAAFPSGHVAWALVAGGLVAALARPWWIRALGALYPLMVVVLVVATAHHFLLDAVGAAVVVALAAAVTRAALGRSAARPALG
jgi:hypothetical protein